MDNNNMNGDPQMDANQQMNANPQTDASQQTNIENQQMYANQQMYGQQMAQNQQMYGQQMDPNQQMYANQQMYGQQMDPNQQMYANQQMYGQQMDPNQQMYGQPNGQTPPAPKKSINLGDNKQLIIYIVAAVVALVLVVTIFRGVFGRGKQSPKAIVKTIASAYEHEKPKKIYRLYDKKFLDYMDDEWNMDKEDILDSIEDEIDDFIDDMKDWYDVGKIKNIKVEIEDIDKEKGKGLRDAKKEMEDEADIKISQAATVDFEWEVIGKDDDYTAKGTAYVYKRMGKWYLVEWYVY